MTMSIFKLEISETLVTYYMLPLLGVNKSTFARQFKNSYIDSQGLKIYVELSSNMKSPIYESNPNYVTKLVVRNKIFLQFVLPTKYIKEGKHFVRGEYSKFSKQAKKLIYKTSTLPYNTTAGSFTVSHPVLQALDKTITLRTFLNDTIGTSLDPTVELMEAPKSDWFIENQI